MIKVKIRNKGSNFTIPIPYALVHLGKKIITSNFSQRKFREWIYKRIQKETEAAQWSEYNNNGLSSDAVQTNYFNHTNHTSQTEQNIQSLDILLRIMEQNDIKAIVEDFLEVIDQYRGLVIVDIHSHDGTGVWIKL